MTHSAIRRGGQTIAWNGSGGEAWVEIQALLDRLFSPVEALLADEVAGLAPRSVLDIGCGTGATTLAAARRLPADARCLGIDISQPMIAAAKLRAKAEAVDASFVVADAQRHRFASAGYDALISRFGVMFFDDFAAAFANLRSAARDGAALRWVAWRGIEENPFMVTAERAAAPLLRGLPARDPLAPGQFALADRERTRHALSVSGWADVAVEPVDFACSFPAGDLTAYFTRLGPVGEALRHADAVTRARVVEMVRPAFDRFVKGTQVHLTAACWLIAARAG
jgi:SAM-dependent methyltransferase